MPDMLAYIAAPMAIVAISAFCAITKRGFSLHTFLACDAIAISVLVWTHIFPKYMIVFSVLSIVIILFGKIDRDTPESVSGE